MKSTDNIMGITSGIREDFNLVEWSRIKTGGWTTKTEFTLATSDENVLDPGIDRISL